MLHQSEMCARLSTFSARTLLRGSPFGGSSLPIHLHVPYLKSTSKNGKPGDANYKNISMISHAKEPFLSLGFFLQSDPCAMHLICSRTITYFILHFLNKIYWSSSFYGEWKVKLSIPAFPDKYPWGKEQVK